MAHRTYSEDALFSHNTPFHNRSYELPDAASARPTIEPGINATEPTLTSPVVTNDETMDDSGTTIFNDELLESWVPMAAADDDGAHNSNEGRQYDSNNLPITQEIFTGDSDQFPVAIPALDNGRRLSLAVDPRDLKVEPAITPDTPCNLHYGDRHHCAGHRNYEVDSRVPIYRHSRDSGLQSSSSPSIAPTPILDHYTIMACHYWLAKYSNTKPSDVIMSSLHIAFDVPSEAIRRWFLNQSYVLHFKSNSCTVSTGALDDLACRLWLHKFPDSRPTPHQMMSLSVAFGGTQEAFSQWFSKKLTIPCKKENAADDTSETAIATIVSSYRLNRRICNNRTANSKRDSNPKAKRRKIDHDPRPFECTSGCPETFKDKESWKRHEEINRPQKLWLCKLQDCRENPENPLVYFRLDHFKTHLSKKHASTKFTSTNISDWCEPIPSNFDETCYFHDCSRRFKEWQERINHIAKHFTASYGMSGRSTASDQVGNTEAALATSQELDTVDKEVDAMDVHAGATNEDAEPMSESGSESSDSEPPSNGEKSGNDDDDDDDFGPPSAGDRSGGRSNGPADDRLDGSKDGTSRTPRGQKRRQGHDGSASSALNGDHSTLRNLVDNLVQNIEGPDIVASPQKTLELSNDPIWRHLTSWSNETTSSFEDSATASLAMGSLSMSHRDWTNESPTPIQTSRDLGQSSHARSVAGNVAFDGLLGDGLDTTDRTTPIDPLTFTSAPNEDFMLDLESTKRMIRDCHHELWHTVAAEHCGSHLSLYHRLQLAKSLAKAILQHHFSLQENRSFLRIYDVYSLGSEDLVFMHEAMSLVYLHGSVGFKYPNQPTSQALLYLSTHLSSISLILLVGICNLEVPNTPTIGRLSMPSNLDENLEGVSTESTVSRTHSVFPNLSVSPMSQRYTSKEWRVNEAVTPYNHLSPTEYERPSGVLETRCLQVVPSKFTSHTIEMDKARVAFASHGPELELPTQSSFRNFVPRARDERVMIESTEPEDNSDLGGETTTTTLSHSIDSSNDGTVSGRCKVSAATTITSHSSTIDSEAPRFKGLPDPLPCDYCSMGCSGMDRITNMRRHVREHHEIHAKYVCDQKECHRQFVRRSNLQRHYKSVHPGREYTGKIQSYSV